MILYFLRHAEAEDSAASDHERKLTARGTERLKVTAKGMAALGIKPAYIFSSPRVRAQQTAEIAAQALGRRVDIREEVNYGFDLAAVDALIAGLPDDSEVMFVGHEPSFSTTIGELTGGAVEMKKGGLARVDVTNRQPLKGVLVWLVAPKVFDVLDKK